MKKCPYCAEEIQDEAIKCRYCMSDLTVPPPQAAASDAASAASTAPAASTSPAASPGSAGEGDTGSTDAATSSADVPSATAEAASPGDTPAQPSGGTGASSTWGTSSSSTWGAPSSGPATTSAPASAPATASGAAQKYTHSGYRYVLGYGPDFFGIWNRDNPSMPTERYPRTDQGWRDAWSKFASLEPNHMPVPDGAGTSAPGAGAPAATGMGATTMGGSVAPQIDMNPSDTSVLQYTHSGSRYLLGYGQTFFGIWDRQNPATPVERFPRSDDGWAQAWRRYSQIENNFTEVH